MREVRMRGERQRAKRQANDRVGKETGEGAGEGNLQRGARIVDKRWGNLTTNRKLSPLPKKMLFCLMLCCHIAIGKLQFQVGKNGLNGIRVIFGGEAKT